MKITKGITVGIIIILVLITGCVRKPTSTSTQTSEPTPVIPAVEQLKVVGQLGGPVRAIAVAGNYGYVGVGLTLVVLDISNPAEPKELGTTEPFGYNVESVSVIGSRAYVAAGGAGLYIVELTKATNPVIVGNLDTQGYAEGVIVVGKYAYVADGPDGIRVIDVSNATHPVEIASVCDDIYALDVATDANYAYIAGAGSGLLVVDISNPVQPRQISYFDTPGYAYALSISAKTAYIADGWGGLIAVDISNPSQPKELQRLKTTGWAYDVAVESKTAYVADGVEGLTVIDVSIPTALKELSNYRSADGKPTMVTDIAVNGTLVCLADYAQGLQFIDVSNATKPTLAGAYSPLGYADDVKVVGDYAYVAAGRYGLRIVDVSNPYRPREIGTYSTGSNTLSIDVVGSYAYIGTELTGLEILDVSIPSHPKQAGVFSNAKKKGNVTPTSTMQDIVVRQNLAYIVNELGMHIVDVSNPLVPEPLSYLDLQGLPGVCAWGINVSNNLVFIAQQKNGLQIVDISNPRDPAVLGKYSESNINYLDVVSSGNSTYVLDNKRLHNLDASDPKNIRLRGSTTFPSNAERMILAEDMIYLASGAAGLQTIDVASLNSNSPALVTRLPGYAMGLDIYGGRIYVADGVGGLFILQDSSKTIVGKPTASLNFTNTSIPSSLVSTSFIYYSAQVKDNSSGTFSTTKTDDNQLSYQAGMNSPYYASQANSKPSASGTALLVNSAADSGPGTLRQAIEKAVSGDTITFDSTVFTPKKPVIINLNAGLPPLNQGRITIDASNSGVVLDGGKISSGTVGLHINSDNNIIKGLQILNFTGNGITITGANNVIGGDRFQGNGPLGEGNLVSKNGVGMESNISIVGSSAVNNKVVGNLIGTDISGTTVQGNRSGDSGFGVMVALGASRNVIGGTTTAERNIIAGDGYSMVVIGEKSSMNDIVGNYIGTDSTGKLPLGKAHHSISIELGGYNNIIKDNVINGSGDIGILINDWGSWGNQIIGNFIGTNNSGTIAVSSYANGGIQVNSFNKVGGTAPEERNVISVNGGCNISVKRYSENDIVILGNFIGTDINGTKPIGNVKFGIVLAQGTHHTFIGGATSEERNLVSGNYGKGVMLDGIGSDFNFIMGNYLGTDVNGSASLTNQGTGIEINAGDHNFIQNNLIANNGKSGIFLNSGNFNLIHHNTLQNNGKSIDGGNQNQWDNGHQGNYWSDYSGKDRNDDSLGDMPYQITPNGTDRFPLMKPPKFTTS